MATGELVSLSEQQLVDCDHEVSIVPAVDFSKFDQFNLILSLYLSLCAISDVMLVLLYILVILL